MDAFKKLKKHSVLVYINAEGKDRWEHVYPTVSGAIHGKGMGHIYPKAVVTSPDQLQVFAMMNHKQLEQSSAYSKVSKAAKKGAAGEELESLPEYVLHWPVAGSAGFLMGPFVRLENDNKLFLKVKGKVYGNKLKEFRTGSQQYARHLHAQNNPTDAAGVDQTTGESSVTDVTEAAMEAWHSAKGGKTIQARFVTLSGDRITLEKEDGKTVTFKLSLLSEQSQQRAKELGTK